MPAYADQAPRLRPGTPGLEAGALPCARARHRPALVVPAIAPSLAFSADDTDLVEQRPAVERVPFGVGDQAGRSSLRQRSESERARQLDEIARIETAQADTSDS